MNPVYRSLYRPLKGITYFGLALTLSACMWGSAPAERPQGATTPTRPPAAAQSPERPQANEDPSGSEASASLRREAEFACAADFDRDGIGMVAVATLTVEGGKTAATILAAQNVTTYQVSATGERAADVAIARVKGNGDYGTQIAVVTSQEAGNALKITQEIAGDNFGQVNPADCAPITLEEADALKGANLPSSGGM